MMSTSEEAMSGSCMNRGLFEPLVMYLSLTNSLAIF
jgi:hypothetical protein